MDVALARCLKLPEPDADEAILLAALRSRGLSAGAPGWDDPTYDPRDARITVLRATWNYPDSPGAFLAWCERTAAASVLWNPLPVVRWNLHKRYLLDLADAGVPIVSTRLVERGETLPLDELLADVGWDDAIVKPAIGASSRGAFRVLRSEAPSREEEFRSLVRSGDVLLQPYLSSVESDGERSLVWIDGELTHAVRKARRLAGDVESVTGPVAIRPAEQALALRAIAAAPGPLLYARVDMAADAAGEPRLMELELIEPSLFLAFSPAAQDRLADAIAKRAEELGARRSA